MAKIMDLGIHVWNRTAESQRAEPRTISFNTHNKALLMQFTSFGFLYFHIRLLSKKVVYVYKYSGYAVDIYTKRA